MKYPCSDGIDRDREIETYLTTERKLELARLRAGALAELIEDYEKELAEIDHQDLGSIGMAALEAARPNFSPQPEPDRYEAHGRTIVQHTRGGEKTIAQAEGGEEDAAFTARRIATSLNQSEAQVLAIAHGAAIMGGFPRRR